MAQRTCSIPGCDRPHIARGWCGLHYQRWTKMGSAYAQPATVEERFWSKVDRSGECWNWTAYLRYGYGLFQPTEGQNRMAHRVAYEWLIGPIPDGLELDHLCRNRACVNPRHLEPVTRLENLLRSLPYRRVPTACPHGHAYTPENSIYEGGKARRCRTCRQTRVRAA